MNDKVTVIHGDCLDVMRGMAADSIDAVVTDPPYHLTNGNGNGGFMSKTWDGGNIAFRVETWQEVLRILKPGAFLLAFSSCRTYHRMAVAVEDAGFVLHPMKAWIFGSGFPKATNFAKQFDENLLGFSEADDDVDWRMSRSHFGTYWSGHRGGLQAEKPALEPILFAQKPLSESTIASNVLRWGVGGLNIDATRIPASSEDISAAAVPARNNLRMFQGNGVGRVNRLHDMSAGRWPPSVCHDGSESVMAEFARFGDAGGGGQNRKTHGRINGMFAMPSGTASYKEDTGSAARFFPTFPLSSDERMFYSAKAGKDDRLSSKHCTVKPVALIRWLCRLITPPNGTILDPFAGSGTTGSAALAEGFRCVLIEKEAEHYRDILDRLAHIKGDDTPLFAKPKAQAGLFD